MGNHPPYLPYVILGAVVVLGIYVVRYFLRSFPRDWKNGRDGDFASEFQDLLSKEERWGDAQKDVISQIMRKWTQENCSGVILAEASPKGPTNKYQMIAFQGPAKMRQMPMIEIHWGYVSTLERAKLFHKGDKVEVIEVDPDTFQGIFQHIASYCSADEESVRIDAIARCKIHEGYLSPQY